MGKKVVRDRLFTWQAREKKENEKECQETVQRLLDKQIM